jgi:pentatricopeptide repeat protein
VLNSLLQAFGTLIHEIAVLLVVGTVLKALARDRDPSAINRAEAVFSEYQEACDSGKSGISHNAFTYNTMINCYAKSNDPDAGKRALELFETMKANMGEPGWELCFVDVYTYTSLIDSISKLQSHEASEQAISLLKEVEESFAKTGDMRFQPNIRLYTSVVNAIGRSHKYPDRAKAIVDRVESKHLEGITGKEGKPDVVFYNALMNAYGWSDEEGRSRKTFEILKHMISLFESGRLADAKPDTVSFNSVLNACVHEKTKDQSTSDDIMKTVVEAFELLNGSPEYGKPDQRTYVHILHSIANHMAKKDDKRTQMAEATFLQCASNGLVGHAVIPKLHMTVPRSRFQTLMGPASKGDGSTLKYDVSELPTKWTANALTRNSRNGRRTRSRRSQSNLQVTKKVISSSTQQS